MTNIAKKKLLQTISNLDHHHGACTHAKKHGLAVMSVTWEDTARFKGSCLGPNISDMTLEQDGKRMPVTRPPNFSDVTMDVPINKIRIPVGNHAGKALEYVTLDVFLKDIRKYVTDPDSFKFMSGDDKPAAGNLLNPKTDNEKAILSAQSCFLAMHEQEDVKFNVNLYNYQSSRKNPKVLVITACAQGTSVTLCDNGTTKLLFNANGDARKVVAKSLSAHRGVEKTDLETKMDNEEKALNSFIVIQVPLVNDYKPPAYTKRGMMLMMEGSFSSGGFGSAGPKKGCLLGASQASPPVSFGAPSFGSAGTFGAAPSNPPAPAAGFSFGVRGGVDRSEPRHVPKDFSDIEHAILGVHHLSLGKFREGTPSVAIARDTKYPIRITFQYYKVTRTDDLTERHFEIIKNQLAEAEALATAKGSLVTEGNTGRETEWMQVDEGAQREDEKWIDAFWDANQDDLKKRGYTTKDSVLQRLRALNKSTHNVFEPVLASLGNNETASFGFAC